MKYLKHIISLLIIAFLGYSCDAVEDSGGSMARP